MTASSVAQMLERHRFVSFIETTASAHGTSSYRPVVAPCVKALMLLRRRGIGLFLLALPALRRRDRRLEGAPDFTSVSDFK